jgi:hypothetical protein
MLKKESSGFFNIEQYLYQVEPIMKISLKNVLYHHKPLYKIKKLRNNESQGIIARQPQI